MRKTSYSGENPGVFIDLIVKKKSASYYSPTITYDSKYSDVWTSVFSVRLWWGGLGMDSGPEKDSPTGRWRWSPLSLR